MAVELEEEWVADLVTVCNDGVWPACGGVGGGAVCGNEGRREEGCAAIVCSMQKRWQLAHKAGASNGQPASYHPSRPRPPARTESNDITRLECPHSPSLQFPKSLAPPCHICAVGGPQVF